jgi:small subunit ribosomal protein S13
MKHYIKDQMSKNTNVSFLKSFIQKNYGISTSTSGKIFKNLGLNIRINSTNFKRRKQTEINKKVLQTTTGKKLQDKIQSNLLFLSKNKTYKGIRHKLKYPARGQRTHTNAKTKKKFRF